MELLLNLFSWSPCEQSLAAGERGVHSLLFLHTHIIKHLYWGPAQSFKFYSYSKVSLPVVKDRGHHREYAFLFGEKTWWCENGRLPDTERSRGWRNLYMRRSDAQRILETSCLFVHKNDFETPPWRCTEYSDGEQNSVVMVVSIFWLFNNKQQFSLSLNVHQ